MENTSFNKNTVPFISLCYFKGIQTEVSEKFCWTEFLKSSGTVTASVGCHSCDTLCSMSDLIIHRPHCGQFSGLFIYLIILHSVQNLSQ